MAFFKIHTLDAHGALTDHRAWLEAAITSAHAAAEEHLAQGPLDVVLRASRRVIPEKGHLGVAPEPGVVFVNVDPENPALLANAERSLERGVVHELHHAARWDGPGYGQTLGEALVSEGLAGWFVQQVYGAPPEPWESLPDDEVRPFLQNARDQWDAQPYDHGAWFFGMSEQPRWLGYSPGFRIVGRHLSTHGGTASGLASADAEDFRPALDALG